MAARYIGQFFAAYTAQQYTVILYDDVYVGDPTTVMIAACDYNYPPGVPGRFDPILAAELSVKILVNTSGLDTFVEDLAGAQEGRFMLQLAQGITPEFIGYVLPDLAQQEDTTLEVGYIFDIRATDGLARLKSIDYNNNGINYTGLAPIADHILNCLNKLPGFAAFYTSAPILRTRVNWHSAQHAYTVGNEDPLDLTRIPHRAFYEVDSKGMFKYKSCFDVLTEICKSFGGRMLYSEYAFWFVQYNEMATDANMKIFSYTLAGAQTNSTVNFRKTHTQTDDGSDLLRLEGGIFRFFPPLRRVQVDYRHIASRNLLSWWASGTPETGVILSDYSQTARLYFIGNMNYSISDMLEPADLPIYVQLRIMVRVGNYYLSRPGSISGGAPSYGPLQWLPDNTQRYVVFALAFAEDVTEVIDITFLSPVLVEDGEFEFSVSQGVSYNLDGSIYLGVAIVLTLLDTAYAELLFQGTLSGQADIRRFRSVNNAADNSAIIELTTIIGDGIGSNSPGHLESFDGTNWVLSEGWRVGSAGAYIANSALLAQEIIRGQLTPVRRFIGEYNNRGSSIYRPHHVIKRADGIMMFAGGRFSPADDAINGEWYFITPQASGWTNEPFEDIQPDTGGGGGSSSGGGSGGGTTTPPLRIFSQHFETVTANTVTVTVNSGLLPTNSAAILVFWNGQLITSDFYTVTGAAIAFTFDIDADVTVKFFIQ